MDYDKVFIEMDEEKLLKKGLSSKKEKSFLNDFFEKYGMTPGEDGWYDKGEFETVGATVCILMQQQWFMDCVKKWYWYDGESGGIEDVLYGFLHGESRYVN